jgi:hypothetical protein
VTAAEDQVVVIDPATLTVVSKLAAGATVNKYVVVVLVARCVF